MNVGGWLLWGFVATVALTATLSACQGMGLTRMSTPYLLGTMFTANRDRAKAVGVVAHFINGWIFSLIYVFAFHSWGAATWWLGAVTGFVHASFVITAGLPTLPAFHPRMANEQQGPTVVRQLEPPGFLVLHYGPRTPLAIILAHLVYGAILGGFYRLS